MSPPMPAAGRYRCVYRLPGASPGSLGNSPIWSAAASSISSCTFCWKVVSSLFCRLISFCISMRRKVESTLASTSWAWKGLGIMSSAPRARPPMREAVPSRADRMMK